MAIEISARKREAQGTGASRRLRRLGKVPGILYGGDKDPINIELDHQDLFLNLRNERFHASILTLDVAGTKEQVLLRSLNMHPFKPQVQHIDFQRVSKDKKIRSLSVAGLLAETILRIYTEESVSSLFIE